MVSVLVAFDTKYGNTKRVAEAIAEGLKTAREIKATVLNIKDVDAKTIPTFDAFLVGSPAHFGGPTGTAKGFIERMGKLKLEGKCIAVFDTYITNPRGSDFEKAVRKLEEHIRKKAPSLTIVSPGLSIRVSGMKGPIADGELPKCQEFGKRFAAQLRK
nr:flavodoxin domain-containing protein [Candidatus Njordarchaeum guaymaensis]